MERKIGRLEVDFSDKGWPHWTQLRVNGENLTILNHEEARDLHYMMSRVVAKLDEVETVDLERVQRNKAQGL